MLSNREHRLLNQFANNNYGLYNKTLARKLGLHTSIFLGELISEYDYWQRREELTSDGFFYSTVENIKEATTLSDYQQRAVIQQLVDLGIIEQRISGMPAKRYFRIDDEKFYEILLEEDSSKETKEKILNNSRTSSKETKEQVLEELKTNNNNITITNNNNNNSNKSEEDLPFVNNKSNLKDISLEGKSKHIKKSHRDQCFEKTYEVVQDEELSQFINEYLEDTALWKQLTLKQWEFRLYTLIKNSNRNLDIAHQIVQQTWQRGYRDFYPVGSNQTNNPTYTQITRETITNNKPQVGDKIF